MQFEYNEIIPDQLWVGTYFRPEDTKRLQRLGISAVVNLQSDQDIQENGIPLIKVVKSLTEANIELRRVPIQDFSKKDIARGLPECVKEIEAALAPRWARAYLHCTAGINRSPTAAAAYLIKARGLSAHDAYDYLLGRRHCSPYLDVLEEYESSIRARP